MTTHLRTILVTTMVLASTLAGQAASLKSMQGAWAETVSDCDEVFVKKGGKLVYKNKASTVDTGIIVSGSRIEGPNATCTAERIKEGKKGTMTVLMSCASHILSGGVSTSFRIIDANHFEHYENAFPDIKVRYQRCKP